MEEPIEVYSGEARLSRMRRSILTTARLITESVESGFRPRRAAMITLTYRDDVEWHPRHVTSMIKAMREWSRRRGHVIPYVWVAELTKRGRMHYHVLVWLPDGFLLPKPDKAGWWQHGWTRIEYARSPVGYIAKYTSKGSSSDTSPLSRRQSLAAVIRGENPPPLFPRGARIYGSGGLDSVVKLIRRWWMLPSWVRNLTQPAHDVRRARGGGWVSRETGEFFRSIWGIVSLSRERIRVIQISQPPPPLLSLPPVSRLEVEALALRDALIAAGAA